MVEGLIPGGAQQIVDQGRHAIVVEIDCFQMK
jgi:hypothetical protein